MSKIIDEFIRAHRWWAPDNEIVAIDDAADSLNYVTVHAQRNDGEWEYAIADWQGGEPRLLMILRAGKVMCQSK